MSLNGLLPAGVCQMCETAKRLGVPAPISIQNDFSLVSRQFEQELAEACAPSNYNIGWGWIWGLVGGLGAPPLQPPSTPLTL